MSRHDSYNQTPRLTQQNIKEILKLQQLFHCKYLTKELLNQLIALYVNAVQCFDNKLAPMRGYFLNKIQFTLSRDQINKMLDGQTQQKLRQTFQINGLNNGFQLSNSMKLRSSQMSEDQKQELQMRNAFNKKKQTKHIQKSKLPNDDHRQKQRALKIQMQLRVMKQMEQNKKNMIQEVQKIQQKQQNHGKQINKVIKKQQEQLNQRLAKRKRKPRKKSAENKKDKGQQGQEQIIIKKQQLIAAQQEINDAVLRFTMRQSMKSMGLGVLPQSKQKQEGRIKIRKIQEDDQQHQQESKINNQNKVNTMFKKSQHKLVLSQQISLISSKQESYFQQLDRDTVRVDTVRNETSRAGTSTQDKGRITARVIKDQDSDDGQFYF